MPYEISVRADDGYAVIRAFGLVSAVERLDASDLLASNPAFVSGMPILIDGRDVVALPTSPETERIMSIHARAFPGHPIAFLVSPGAVYGVARQVSVRLETEGIPAEVFSDPEEAQAWIRSPARHRDP